MTSTALPPAWFQELLDAGEEICDEDFVGTDLRELSLSRLAFTRCRFDEAALDGWQTEACTFTECCLRPGRAAGLVPSAVGVRRLFLPQTRLAGQRPDRLQVHRLDVLATRRCARSHRPAATSPGCPSAALTCASSTSPACKLVDANVVGAKLDRCRFAGANLTGLRWNEASLQGRRPARRRHRRPGSAGGDLTGCRVELDQAVEFARYLGLVIG